MTNFNLKQWLFENKLGAYEKASRLKEFDSEDGFSDETTNRDDMNEVNPAALGMGQAMADAEMQKQDDLNSDWLSLANETVGWATIEKPAMESEGAALDNYLSKLEKHDAYYRMSDDPRTFNRGQAEDAELRRLYSQLSDMEKQTALDAAREMSEKYWPDDNYPGMKDLRRTWTTKTFDGDI
jgi:hypothetical protein